MEIPENRGLNVDQLHMHSNEVLEIQNLITKIESKLNDLASEINNIRWSEYNPNMRAIKTACESTSIEECVTNPKCTMPENATPEAKQNCVDSKTEFVDYTAARITIAKSVLKFAHLKLIDIRDLAECYANLCLVDDDSWDDYVDDEDCDEDEDEDDDDFCDHNCDKCEYLLDKDEEDDKRPE